MNGRGRGEDGDLPGFHNRARSTSSYAVIVDARRSPRRVKAKSNHLFLALVSEIRVALLEQARKSFGDCDRVVSLCIVSLMLCFWQQHKGSRTMSSNSAAVLPVAMPDPLFGFKHLRAVHGHHWERKKGYFLCRRFTKLLLSLP